MKVFLLKTLTIAAIVLVGVGAVVLGGKAVLAVTESPAEDAIKIALASHLKDHPNDQLALLLAQLLLNGSSNTGGQTVGLSDESNETPFGKICLKDSSDPYTCIFEGWEEIDFPTTTTTASEINQITQRLDTDIFIDQCEIELKGTVSSTFNTYLGVVSSSAWNGSIAYNASTGPRPDNLIDGTQYVTSTANIQYASGYRNVRNCWEDQGTLGEQMVRMASSSRFVVFKQSVNDSAFAGNMEQVTSTNGMPTGVVRYHYHGRKKL